MYEIGKREFIQLFKGIKSIIIILILLATSYYSAKFAGLLLTTGIEFTAKEAEGIHFAGISVLLLVFGQLFVMGLSHDSINRETHERTIRFLITRTSRTSVLLGKFLGAWFFWVICVTISFVVISIFARKMDVFIFSQAMSLLTYQIALAILLSVLIPRPGYSMFIGVIIGLITPIFGMWVTETSNIWMSWMKYITPYYYLVREDYTVFVIILLAVIMLFIANLIFRRREC